MKRKRKKLEPMHLAVLGLIALAVYQATASEEKVREVKRSLASRAMKRAAKAAKEVFGTALDETKELLLEEALKRLIGPLAGGTAPKLLKGG